MSDTDVLKVVLIGESGTGKTSIIQRFSYNLFDSNCASSISSQYISKTIDLKDINQSLKFDIWDTAGQEKYRSMAKLFYKDAKIILFVYDITSKKTFDALINFWYEELRNNLTENPIYAVVGNKNDLYMNEKVDKEEVRDFSNEINATFRFTSAVQNTCIDELFKELGKKYVKSDFMKEIGPEYFDKESRNSSFHLEKNDNNNTKKKKCC